MGRKSRSKADRQARGTSAAGGRSAWAATALGFFGGLAAAGLASILLLPRGEAPNAPDARGAARRSAAAQSQLDRARAHLEAHELHEAQAAAERARALAPGDGAVAFLLGDIAYRTLQMQAAERHFRRAAELAPESSGALGSLALVLLELGQARAAADAARQALAIDPDDPRLRAVLGESLLRLGEPGPAAELLGGALEAGLRGARRHATLGRALDMLGRTEPALAAFAEALRQDPHSPLAHYWLAACLRRAGRLAEAERHLEEHRRCQQRVDALARAELRLTLEPEDLRAWLEVARLRVERGFARQALPAAERAAQLAARDPEVTRIRDLVLRASAAPDVEP